MTAKEKGGEIIAKYQDTLKGCSMYEVIDACLLCVDIFILHAANTQHSINYWAEVRNEIEKT